MDKPKLICPYDKSHILYEERFARHLIRCKRNHPNSNKVTCPFNVTHIMDKIELDEHVKECPSRATFERSRIDFTKYQSTDDDSYSTTSSIDQESSSNSSWTLVKTSVRSVNKSYKGKKKLSHPMASVPAFDQQRENIPPVINSGSFQEEDWDADPDVESYKPEEYVVGANVIRQLKGVTPSERKEFRMIEKRRLQNLDKNRQTN